MLISAPKTGVAMPFNGHDVRSPSVILTNSSKVGVPLSPYLETKWCFFIVHHFHWSYPNRAITSTGSRKKDANAYDPWFSSVAQSSPSLWLCLYVSSISFISTVVWKGRSVMNHIVAAHISSYLKRCGYISLSSLFIPCPWIISFRPIEVFVSPHYLLLLKDWCNIRYGMEWKWCVIHRHIVWSTVIIDRGLDWFADWFAITRIDYRLYIVLTD